MRPTILVVEDDDPVARMLEQALAMAGFAVRLASDGLAGWEAFQADRPDIVLSDIRMPRMDGVELLARIKALDPEMDVVLLTGHGELPTAIQAIELGAYRYLEKPIHQIADLAQTLSKALEQRQLRRDRQLIDRISQDLSGRLSLSDFLDQFLQHLLAAFPQVNAAFISLYDSEQDCLVITRTHGFPESDLLLGSRIDPGWSIGAQAFASASPIRLDARQVSRPDIQRYPDRGMPRPLFDFILAHPTLGVLGIPIISHDEPVGSLAVVNTSSIDAFDDHINRLLTTLCRQVGLYLRNARLYAELQTQTGRLKAVIDSTVDGMVLVDPAGHVLMANPRFRAFFAPNQVAERQFVDALQQRLAQATEVSFDFVLPAGRGDEPMTLETFAARLGPAGESIGSVASLRDVTLLRSLSRRRSDLLSRARHDARTPLAIIHTYVHNLLKLGGRLSEADRTETLRQISQLAEEVDRSVTDSLAYSTLKEQLWTSHKTRLNLSQLAAELGQQMALLAEQQGQSLSSQIEEGLWVRGEANALRRALRNLLDNAIKFTPAGGTILLRARRAGAAVQIQVQDDGPGIPEDEQEAIFDPYYRGSTAGDKPGTGLGLSVVRDIVAAHQGQVTVDGPPQGGSIFTVTLPAVPHPS